MTPNTDFYLRVSNNSELGKMMTLLSDGDSHLGTALKAVGGLRRSPWLLKTLQHSFDNLSVDVDTSTVPDGGDSDLAAMYKMQYIDVVGRQQTVVNVQQAEFAGGGSSSQADSDFEEIRWPVAPPQIQPMDFFRKPNWFEPMRAMVGLGKHISLAGPPGVGKDTAVMQLAAEEGRPLVVVGGDAGLRKRDLVGSVELQNGSSYFQVAEFAAAAVNGWWAVITEVNAADPDALLLLNGIIETPHVINIHGKAYPVHPDFRLFISYNPGLIGTKPLPQSFKDRFMPFQVGFLTETELRRRLEAHGMPAVEEHAYTITYGDRKLDSTWQTKIVKYGLALWSDHSNGKIRFQITVRRLKDAVDLMNCGVTDDVKKALKMAVLGTIDSPVEYKVAEQTLNAVMDSNYYKE